MAAMLPPRTAASDTDLREGAASAGDAWEPRHPALAPLLGARHLLPDHRHGSQRLCREGEARERGGRRR